jgi:parallel beta-helix repeat protein
MSDLFENKGALASTIVVAAADSLNQGQANYVCDGTNDHVEIQAALDALPATGGEVLLLDGTYNVEVSLVLDSYQTLRGCGRNTILTTSTNGLIFLSATGGSGTEKTGITIYDMKIDGATISSYGIHFTYVDYSLIQNVDVWRTDDIGIYLVTSDFNTLLANISRENLSYGIDIEAGNNNKISANIAQDNLAEGILLDSTSSGNTLTGNIIKGNLNGIYIGPASDDNAISGNVCEGNGAGIYIKGDKNTIGNNICRNNDGQGIVVTSGHFNNVVGNTCQGNGTQGISVVVAEDTLVGNNFCIGNSQTTDNTYANILVDDATRVFVKGNVCRHGGGAKQPDYGLEHVGTLHGIIAQGNDLYDSGKTDNLYDTHSGSYTIIGSDNLGIRMTQIKEFVYAKNTSGAQISWGYVVRHKAVATGYEFDNPTAIGEDSVLGVLGETIDNNEWGHVQVAGKTTILRATNAGGNIAIGDYLCTENGNRARLAAAGDMAFARALEGCGGANCTIDALIISPMRM